MVRIGERSGLQGQACLKILFSWFGCLDVMSSRSGIFRRLVYKVRNI